METSIVIVQWFDDEYRVTTHKDAGVTHIEKLYKRKGNKEIWRVVFSSHTELLSILAKSASAYVQASEPKMYLTGDGMKAYDGRKWL